MRNEAISVTIVAHKQYAMAITDELEQFATCSRASTFLFKDNTFA